MDDTFLLSRIQFGLNISFHILFPAITIALGWFLLFFKLRYGRTKDRKWLDLYFFWTKVFALSFSIGVVSGVTMPFQFGTNWPGFMDTVGNIAGPLLAYEVLVAFFLEATFLAIMLFAFNKVPVWFHNLATLLVAVGTTLSAFTILTLDSWMVFPRGFEMREGIAYATSWYDIIINSSNIYRFVHMSLTSGLTVSFMIAGISAYRWLRKDRTPAVLSGLRVGVYMSALMIVLQFWVGDRHGEDTARYQPQTMAAMEAVWDTGKGVPFVVFGIPDAETRTNKYEIAIPKLASLLITRDPDGEVRGINDFPEHPPVMPVFYAFRVMIGIGTLMLAVALPCAFFLKRRGDITPFWARVLLVMTFSGWIACLSGWYVTEIGRQPYLVQGVLKTADAVTKLGTGMVWTTFLMYLAAYVIVLPSFIFTLFYLARKEAKPQTTPEAN